MSAFFITLGNYIKENAPNLFKQETYTQYGHHIFYASAIAGAALVGWPFAAGAIAAIGARFAWNRYMTRKPPQTSKKSESEEHVEDDLIVKVEKRILPPPEKVELHQIEERPAAVLVEEAAPAKPLTQMELSRKTVLDFKSHSINIVKQSPRLTETERLKNILLIERSTTLILASKHLEARGKEPFWFAEKQKKYVAQLRQGNPWTWMRLGLIKFKNLF